MKITNLRKEENQKTSRVAATVEWEDTDRPTRDIFFDTLSRFSDALTCNPNAFLLACVLPAMYHGERRVTIEGGICPELYHGLQTVMGHMGRWYGKAIPRVESSDGFIVPPYLDEPHAASFLTGGVDSMAVLRENRLDYPLNHPESIKSCLLVHGLDLGGEEGGDSSIDIFEDAIAALKRIEDDANVQLIPVYTNIRHLEDRLKFYVDYYFGSALCAAAHALTNRISKITIGSGLDIDRLEPHGSHPLIDSNYSGSNLRVHHHGVQYGRFDKVKIVAGWDEALKCLRVCTNPHFPEGQLNCGICEKCIRTMTELLVLGKLSVASAFPLDDITPELIYHVKIRSSYQEGFYQELVEPLQALGRDDLVGAVSGQIHDWHQWRAWKQEFGWKGKVKKFDRKYLGGFLAKATGWLPV